MDLPELIAACSKEPALRFLLIGGHAVIAHGYARTTFDVDFLVRTQQREDWTMILQKWGYALKFEAQSFAQFSPQPEGEQLDLMMVSDATFERMWQSGTEVRISGLAVKIPSLDHLLALKLHVLKQNLGHRAIKDLDDVIRLALANHLDIRSDHYKKLFEKYGRIEDYERVLSATHAAPG